MFWISVDLKKSAVMALSARKQIVFWYVKAFLNYKIVLKKKLSLLEGTEQNQVSCFLTV